MPEVETGHMVGNLQEHSERSQELESPKRVTNVRVVKNDYPKQGLNFREKAFQKSGSST